MLKLIVIGLLAGVFFSSTFVLNELMSHANGHWFWSASLRYLFMFAILTLVIGAQHGLQRIIDLFAIFTKHWRFWCVTGGIGSGLFYAGICYAADHASGWVVASTFMFTVVASLFVLAAFGQRFSKQVIVFALLIFLGVVLVNLSEVSQASPTEAVSGSSSGWQVIVFGALPALVAAFSYPFGNQLVWQASHNASNQSSTSNTTSDTLLPVSLLHRFIPTIETDLLSNAFNKIWLMTLGSFPLWGLLAVVIRPPLPNADQVFNTFLVALFSGIIATALFLYARGQARSSQQVAGVDATQASEIIFALIGGIILLGTPLPSVTGIIGIMLIMSGLVLFAKYA
ncbi:multidrug resistance efflux transporter family protein [Psychrobacter lutiphocae]|uniref:multidrug resistance efflux transporter family protein n=1 Tax=Psychrobacter lutiphocae TaxID=540500 RepID=UPI0003A1AC79|nr:multidrug resistance efflux transporter family protein [Psychrobacter lutiphocae]